MKFVTQDRKVEPEVECVLRLQGNMDGSVDVMASNNKNLTGIRVGTFVNGGFRKSIMSKETADDLGLEIDDVVCGEIINI